MWIDLFSSPVGIGVFWVAWIGYLATFHRVRTAIQRRFEQTDEGDESA